MEAIREQEEFLSTQAEDIGGIQVEDGPGQWNRDFIGRYPNNIITWFLQRYRSVLFLESDFVRGFRPVDPERILLGDVTSDVGEEV